MTLRINISADVRKASAFYRELNSRAMNAAAANAQNIVLRAVRNETLDQIAKVRRVKRSWIRDAVRVVQRAAYFRLTAILQAFGGSISLREYKAKQGPLGVTVNVEGTPKLIRHAFGPGYGRYNKRKFDGHVYTRRTAAKYPVRKHWGPSIPTGFIKAQVRRAQRAVISKQWATTFNAKCEEQLAKLRARFGG